MIDFDVDLKGANHLLSQNTMNLTWSYAADQQESDISFEKQNTQVGYMEDGEFDYHTIGRTSNVNFDKKVKWIGVRQRFFNTFLIAKSDFTGGKMNWNIPPDDKRMVVEAVSNMQLAVPAGGQC
jgi:YidC/Oxa1 family membrane protein insertase